jgi:hypothetical protein
VTVAVTAASAELCSTDFSGLPAGGACPATTTVKNQAELLAWVAGPRTTNLVAKSGGSYDLAGADLTITTACDVTFNAGANLTGLGDLAVTAHNVFVRNDLTPAAGPLRTFHLRAGGQLEVKAASSTQNASIIAESPAVVYRGDVGATAATVALCGDTVETGVGSELRVAELFISAEDELMLRGDVLGATSVTLAAGKVTLRPACMIGSASKPVGSVHVDSGGRFDDFGDIRATGDVTIDTASYRLYQQYSFQAATCSMAGTQAAQSKPLVGCTAR